MHTVYLTSGQPSAAALPWHGGRRRPLEKTKARLEGLILNMRGAPTTAEKRCSIPVVRFRQKLQEVSRALVGISNNGDIGD